MQRKAKTQWGEGSIAVVGNRIVIRQGPNTILVSSEEQSNFQADIETITFPKPVQYPGFGGTIKPIAPKKSMHDLLDNLLYNGRGWHSLK